MLELPGMPAGRIPAVENPEGIALFVGAAPENQRAELCAAVASSVEGAAPRKLNAFELFALPIPGGAVKDRAGKPGGREALRSGALSS